MMQVQLFTIPILSGEKLLDEMNLFLRSHKVLQTERQLIVLGSNAYWCFFISYIASGYFMAGEKQKVDYKEVLDENTFKKFSSMRELRKKIAFDESIPAYAVFTDEELATMAKMEEVTIDGMRKVKGIGDKKVEKYGRFFLTRPDTNEKN
jgi:superfamily II DNA helicase RecQ